MNVIWVTRSAKFVLGFTISYIITDTAKNTFKDIIYNDFTYNINKYNTACISIYLLL